MAFSIEYEKEVLDRATRLDYLAVTCIVGSIGTHGQEWSYILSNLSRDTDKFIDEYLRVNRGRLREVAPDPLTSKERTNGRTVGGQVFRGNEGKVEKRCPPFGARHGRASYGCFSVRT